MYVALKVCLGFTQKIASGSVDTMYIFTKPGQKGFSVNFFDNLNLFLKEFVQCLI